MKRLSWFIGSTALFIGLAACNGIPPTVVVMQITNTPDPRVISVTITNTAPPGTVASTALPLATVLSSAAPTSTTAAPVANVPTSTVPVTIGALPAQPTTAAQPTVALLTPTALAPSSVPPTAALPTNPNATDIPATYVPTDTRQQLTIAQEDFQFGYMFWIQPTHEIWILLPDVGNTVQPTHGQWRVFKDTFVDGEPESDPSLTPPSGDFQPKRGFGKLWRNEPDIRGALGWGTTPEFGINTSYVYQPGGAFDPTQNKWIAGPGTHFLISLGRATFAFYEPKAGQTFGTWDRKG